MRPENPRETLRSYLEFAPFSLALVRTSEIAALAGTPFERPVIDLDPDELAVARSRKVYAALRLASIPRRRERNRRASCSSPARPDSAGPPSDRVL